MSDVYSTQLAAYASLGGIPSLIYVAPPAQVTVITQIGIVLGLNVVLVSWNIVHTPSGAKIAGASYPAGTTDWTFTQLPGRWVLNPGEELTFASSGALCDVFLSGFLLSLP